MAAIPFAEREFQLYVVSAGDQPCRCCFSPNADLFHIGRELSYAGIGMGEFSHDKPQRYNQHFETLG